jgi:hypothetical protein
MERIYHGNDGIVNANAFDDWVMSAKGVKRLYYNTIHTLETFAMYRFKDCTLNFWESGSWRDGAPIEIKVEGDTKKTVKDICSHIERVFPSLKQN